MKVGGRKAGSGGDARFMSEEGPVSQPQIGPRMDGNKSGILRTSYDKKRR